MEPLWTPDGPSTIVHGDNLAVARQLPDASFRLVYLDPPFNTGRRQRHRRLRTVRMDEGGDRVGFGGNSYQTSVGDETSYDDRFADYAGFLEPRLHEARRLLDAQGTLYLHLDYREAHYAKIALDRIFGRDSFLNELIWAYDYGAKAQRRWPAKHDTILVYVKDPNRYWFENAAVDREPYMAPGLVTPEKAERGKLPTDVWWHTIVGTNSHERTGYPTQKPEGVLRRIVQASSAPSDWVLDLFAGSGTTGAVASALDRRFLLVDESPDAIAVMRARLPQARFVESYPAATLPVIDPPDEREKKQE